MAQVSLWPATVIGFESCAGIAEASNLFLEVRIMTNYLASAK